MSKVTRLFDIISLWVNIQVLLLTKNASKILYPNYFKVQSALFNRIVVTFVHDARRHFLVDFKREIDNVVILHPILHPKKQINTGGLGRWCRKCRFFPKTFFERVLM